MVQAVIRKAIKLGSSIATTIDKDMAEQLGIREGTLIKQGISNGQLIIEPVDTKIEVRDTAHKKIKLNTEDGNGRAKKTKEVAPTVS